jgi:hypothetical protein
VRLWHKTGDSEAVKTSKVRPSLTSTTNR